VGGYVSALSTGLEELGGMVMLANEQLCSINDLRCAWQRGLSLQSVQIIAKIMAEHPALELAWTTIQDAHVGPQFTTKEAPPPAARWDDHTERPTLLMA